MSLRLALGVAAVEGRTMFFVLEEALGLGYWEITKGKGFDV